MMSFTNVSDNPNAPPAKVITALSYASDAFWSAATSQFRYSRISSARPTRRVSFADMFFLNENRLSAACGSGATQSFTQKLRARESRREQEFRLPNRSSSGLVGSRADPWLLPSAGCNPRGRRPRVDPSAWPPSRSGRPAPEQQAAKFGVALATLPKFFEFFQVHVFPPAPIRPPARPDRADHRAKPTAGLHGGAPQFSSVEPPAKLVTKASTASETPQPARTPPGCQSTAESD